MPARGWKLELLDVEPMKGGGPVRAVRGALVAAVATRRAFGIVRACRPSAVLSVGGYASGPVTLAAAMLGVPVTVMEPNSVVGLANRLVAPFTKRAYLAWREAEGPFRAEAVRQYGVPLRPGFGPRPYSPRSVRARPHHGRQPGRTGSQRAHAAGVRLALLLAGARGPPPGRAGQRPGCTRGLRKRRRRASHRDSLRRRRRARAHQRRPRGGPRGCVDPRRDHRGWTRRDPRPVPPRRRRSPGAQRRGARSRRRCRVSPPGGSRSCAPRRRD